MLFKKRTPSAVLRVIKEENGRGEPSGQAVAILQTERGQKIWEIFWK